MFWIVRFLKIYFILVNLLVWMDLIKFYFNVVYRGVFLFGVLGLVGEEFKLNVLYLWLKFKDVWIIYWINNLM